MRAHKELVRDPLAYVESIGRQDRSNTLDALGDEGADTILRVCLAPVGNVPMRAYGYIAAAKYVQHAYMPKAQLQVVLPQQTLARVNGVPEYLSRRAEYELSRELFYVPRPAYSMSEMLLAKDTTEPPYINLSRLSRVIRGVKGEEQLKRQAQSRHASHLEYVAGHVILHDIATSVEPLSEKEVAPLQSARIISIGAQTERPFYNARMACREKDLWGPQLAESTGQLFTRHTLPPYTPRRQPVGGPQLFDPVGMQFEAFEDPIMSDEHARRYDPVVRDIAHLHDYILMAYNSYSEQEHVGI